jgi:hypothetical protein
MRFRFSIRDLFWLAALITVCLEWSIDHARTQRNAKIGEWYVRALHNQETDNSFLDELVSR